MKEKMCEDSIKAAKEILFLSASTVLVTTGTFVGYALKVLLK